MTVIDEKSTFKTSDGRDIAFVPGWFENKNQWPYGITDFRTFVERCVLTETSYPRDPSFLLNKLITANSVKCLLEENGYDFGGEASMLNICTGPAVLPRVFKALGLCKEAHGVDVEDRGNAFTDDQLIAIWEIQ